MKKHIVKLSILTIASLSITQVNAMRAITSRPAGNTMSLIPLQTMRYASRKQPRPGVDYAFKTNINCKKLKEYQEWLRTPEGRAHAAKVSRNKIKADFEEAARLTRN